MAKGKNKHGEGGKGPSSKLEEVPILAATLAKPKHILDGGRGESSSTICKHVEIEWRSLAMMFNNSASSVPESEVVSNSEVHIDLDAFPKEGNEGDTLGDEDSLTLGDEDSSLL
ncbi:hypothetical protein Acr_00g0053910 [Actinidia rufa]|uniref:Uncharacterized protein n=1 Tax=Actinidia rufa TaxID=165716 RepID=A0A7J0DLG4_9ERIC|nr:hypothetical protein Acr_00g0053910 [Actinidia rufa]